MPAFVYKYLPQHVPYMTEQIWEARPDLGLYARLSEFEHEQIKDYVGRPKKVLDLGCGLGRAAIYLNHVLADPEVHFVLADITGTTEDSKSPWDHMPLAPWNDLGLTASFAQLNGLKNFETFNLLTDSWDRLCGIDFVTSRCSVGMHFPIEDVMPKLLAATAEDCTMIFGCRSKPQYATMFRDTFREVIWLPQEQRDGLPQQDWLILKGKK